jgi:glutathione S-transferase
MSETTARATLYVIAGSHACRTGMLLLEHKGIAFQTRELPTGAHPWLVRALGFPGNPGALRDVGRPAPVLRAMDRLGTVPALRYGDQRIQTNTRIIEFLDAVQPDPPLWPAEEQLRERAREAQRWGDESFQMLARLLALAGGIEGKLQGGGSGGRLGNLLAHNGLNRKVVVNVAGRVAFRTPGSEASLLERLPAALDRIDGWMAEGVLGAAEPNAADYTIAPCLALLDYRLDLRERLRERPSFELVRRLLPEPGS